MSSTASKNSKRLSRKNLRPYQEAMVDWILEKPACALYAEMGLGKTIAALTAVRDLVYSCMVKKVLIVAPLRVATYTWPAELDEWEHVTGLTFETIMGTPRIRERLLQHEADIHIINAELLVWLVDYWGKKWPYDMVILDEASMFKSHKSKRFRALRKVRSKIDRIVQLTGTPAANSLLGLWSQALLLDMGQRLGRTYTGFRDTYFMSDFHGYTWTPRKGTHAHIYGKLGDICMTLKAEDYIELPDRVMLYDTVELPLQAAAAYREVEKHFLVEIDDLEVVAANAAAKTGKLTQMAQGAVYVDEEGEARKTVHIHDAKLEALDTIVDARENQNILVAYTYKSDLARLRERYPQARTLDEVTPEDWNEGTVPMLLVHPQSAGHGLNLQHGGRVAVWFGIPWSLELYQQFNARLHRSGQEHRVFIHHIVAKDTVDETIVNALGRKDTTQSALLNALKRDIEGRLQGSTVTDNIARRRDAEAIEKLTT